METADYLARIAFTAPTPPNSNTLRLLHLAHLYAVPFENLDISLGREILCDEQCFFHKIVTRRRGGFCYELNGAFAGLLRGLGFKVTMLSARVCREDGGASPEFDHLALLVDLEEPWLADVGFGDSFLEPLRLIPDIEQEQEIGCFRIVVIEDTRIVQRRIQDGTWKSQYQFTLQPHPLSDFDDRCRFQQTSTDSHFTRQRICTLPTAEGRITLSDLKLIRTTRAGREESILKNEDEWRAALEKYFGVKL